MDLTSLDELRDESRPVVAFKSSVGVLVVVLDIHGRGFPFLSLVGSQECLLTGR